MAVTVITPTSLTLDTTSGAVTDSDIVTGTDGASIAVAKHRKLLLRLVPAAGEVFTIAAGDLPPSHRKGLGSLAIDTGTTVAEYVVIDASRFKQNDGTILVTTTTNNTKITAFLLPDTL